MNKMSREEAWELLTEYTKTPALRKHALAVEAVLSHFARLNDEDSEVWGVAGLLHDLDYEKFPDQHCQKAEEIMRESGVDETYIRAMKCHGYGICTDVKPESNLEKTLFTVDELTGLINALCLMRPSKSVLDLEVKSVKKKFKDKKFAAGCSRDVITKGAGNLGWELPKLMEMTILAMRSCEDSVAEEMKKMGLAE